MGLTAFEDTKGGTYGAGSLRPGRLVVTHLEEFAALSHDHDVTRFLVGVLTVLNSGIDVSRCSSTPVRAHLQG